MATTITPPAPYSSVKKSVEFYVERPEGSVMEVSINGYVKQYPSGNRRVNVSNYYQDLFDAVPDTYPYKNIFTVRDGGEADRVMPASISVDGIISGYIPLVCADKPLVPDKFMTDLRRRVIARGQVDEIPIYIPDEGQLVYENTYEPIERGHYYIAFHVPQDAPDRFSVRLVDRGGNELDRIDYEIANDSGTRLAWVNAYGAIDYWTFPIRSKSTVKTTKERVYTDQGYATTSIQAEITETVITQPLPESSIRAISRVLMSERAWIINGAGYTPIDITSESAIVYESAKPTAISVDYRNKHREL